MHRHAFVTFALLAACGGKQTTPAPDEAPIDAAPAPVVVVPPDAGPPPPPPAVPPLERIGTADELRALLKSAETDDERILYLGQLAALTWTGACAAPTDGLCVTMVKRAKKAPPTCDRHVDDLETSARPADQVHEALELVGELRQQWGGGSAIHEITDPNAQTEAYIANFHMAEVYGASLLIVGDQAFEEFLKIKSPTGLDFDPDHGGMPKKSLAKFEAWITDLQARATEAISLYQAVTQDPELAKWSPAAQVHAYARMAQLARRFSANLNGLEVPTNLRKDAELEAAFCDTVDGVAEPVDMQAKAFEDACKTLAGAYDLPADRCGP